ncbi:MULTISPECIES: hypothetical protein [unclassified Paenibacillus]|uniref:Uncharacterized protein n=1 Tax=Paenibacillus provencensis TaxID=441151 RepID=A0ABW3PYG1_9BACL|nr:MULTISPECIES: hypothetical protein [unclassified Paenibacillus]MCM3130242.1 hypothetical protein [Paenibacillus sp. MER 78]SDX72391.1 hypothetical protein SAMN05518848_112133 [Paenibacillus sp. PDC88]SFS89285.1 hypothetical protein SAMN04488601_106129 [Paenibacillus sp. 453mf]
MDNKFSSNLIAFISGLLVFSTDFFSRMPSLDSTGLSLFGGYIFLSVYHGWKFAAPRLSNLTSAVVFWLYPVVFGFTMLWAMLIGMMISAPKFVISFFKWRSTRTQATKPLINNNMATASIHTPIEHRSAADLSNVVPLHRKK